MPLLRCFAQRNNPAVSKQFVYPAVATSRTKRQRRIIQTESDEEDEEGDEDNGEERNDAYHLGCNDNYHDLTFKSLMNDLSSVMSEAEARQKQFTVEKQLDEDIAQQCNENPVDTPTHDRIIAC